MSSTASSCSRPARPAPAAEAYREAVALAPKEPLILGGLGRALLNTDDPDDTAEARDALARSVGDGHADDGVLRDLALAEARLGNEGAAALATAERFVLQGRFPRRRPQRPPRRRPPARGLPGLAAGGGYR